MLSESVGKAIQLSGGPEVSETSKFILIFDKFFDLLNVSHFNKYAHRRKPFQQPYHNSKDERLKVSNNNGMITFLIEIIDSGWKTLSYHTLIPGKHLSMQERIVMMNHRRRGCF